MKEEICENEEFAKDMVRKGLLRGIIDCEKHGHHNPYDMYKKGLVEIDPPKEEITLTSNKRIYEI